MPKEGRDEVFEAAEREHEQREKFYERNMRLRNAGLEGTVTDDDHRRIMRNQLEETQCLQMLRGWLKGDAPLFVLLGPTGRGKTVACAWAIAESGGRYMTAKKLERLFLAQYGVALDEQDQTMQYQGLLVVDDVGTELKRDQFTSSLYELVNARQGAGRRTVITSNMGRKEFEGRYRDARLLSRLKRAEFAQIAGSDLREKDRKDKREK